MIGRREHRNSRSCPLKFEQLEGELADDISAFCKQFVALCEDIGQFHMDDFSPDTVVEMLSQQDARVHWCRKKLEAMSSTSKVMQFFFGSHKSLDSAIYELLFWTRCAAGCPCYEEQTIESLNSTLYQFFF